MRARLRGALFSREAALVVLGAIAFGVLFGLYMLRHLTEPYVCNDWDQFRDWDWSAVYTLTHFHQFPFWSPYQCGGVLLLANPQSRILTPFFPLHLLFGTLGLNLETPAHLAIAWAGGYVLARSLGLSGLGAVACATAFPAGSWFDLHVSVGHLNFLSYAYLPWVVGLVQLANRQRRAGWCALAGAIWALTYLEGGIYTASHIALLLAFLAFAWAIARRSPWPVLSVVIAGLFALGFGAVKIVPSVEMIMTYRRGTGAGDHLTIVQVLTALFSRTQNIDRGRLGSYNFFECGAYISPVFALLAIGGFVGSWRRAWPWALAAFGFAVLALGNFGRFSPWTVLHHFPLFSWERMNGRLLIGFTLCVSAGCGYGIDFLSSRRWSGGPALALIALLAGTLDAWMVGAPNLVQIRGLETPLTAPVATFRQYRDPNDGEMLRINLANMGAARCYDPLPMPRNVRALNDPDYKGEQYLLGAGQLRLVQWTPNRLSYDVTVSQPTIMVVNQNYDRSWCVTEGNGEVFSHGGLLAVRIPAGEQRITLGYRDRAFAIGAAVTIATLLIASLAVARETGSRHPASAAQARVA